MFPLTDRITFCTTRVVRESISVSFSMFTGARILLASYTGTMTASEDDSLSRYNRELKQLRRERERLKRQQVRLVLKKKNSSFSSNLCGIRSVVWNP